MDAAVELAQAERENEKLRADNADLGRRLEQLGIDNADLKRQLDWFRRQLFGSKSEKRVEIPPEQMTFWEQLGLEDPKRPEEPEFELAERRKRGKKSFEGAVNESGPGFGPDVPVETVAIDNPEAAGIPESERELVGEKVVHRLAQTACTFRIIRYVARTWKRRDTGELVAAAPPPAVLDRSCADTGFLAGMMVDKFCWHLPLHRQHQRLEAAGIRISRSSLTNWMLRSASLLTPICDAQFRSILESKVIAMDETPIRAGRVGPGRCGRPGSGRSSATATKSPSPSGCPGKTARFPTCSATSRARCFPTATRPTPPTRNLETARFGTPAAGRTPGASSKRRRIPSRDLPPRPWN